MVKEIEHFGPELQPERFVNGKVAMNSEIPLGSTETSQSVSRQVSLPER